ncbi:unnamed protein product [marine sediment metagenome]|uniref:Uncharacterized protein n=1 Tax=marine sediment metagenome TaxID=412755 RepID=X0TTM3_9ZZZZ
MEEHNCRNVGWVSNGDTVKLKGVWTLKLEDDYYNVKIKYCPYCGIKL